MNINLKIWIYTLLQEVKMRKLCYNTINVTKTQKHLKSLDSSIIPCRSQGLERGVRRAWDGFIWVCALEKSTWEMLKLFLKIMVFIEGIHLSCYNYLNSIIWSSGKKTNKGYALWCLPYRGSNATSYKIQRLAWMKWQHSSTG